MTVAARARTLFDPSTWQGLPGLPFGSRSSNAYLLAVLVLEALLVPATLSPLGVSVHVGALLLVPVGIAAWAFGRQVGIVSALLHVPVLAAEEVIGHGSTPLMAFVEELPWMLGLLATGWFVGDLSRLVDRERQEARDLARTQAILARTLEGTDRAIAQFDEKGRLVHANGAYLKAHGRAAHDVIGRTHAESFDCADHQALVERGLHEDAPIDAREVPLACMAPRDGNPTYWDYRVQPLLDHGERAVIVTFEDVTERRRHRIARASAEREVRESEARFRQVADNVDEIIFLASSDLRKVLYVNPAFERMTGLRQDALLADPSLWLAGIREEDQPRLLELLSNEVLQGRPATSEYGWRHTDGSDHTARISAFPILDSAGSVARIAGIVVDTTKERAAQAEIERGRARLEEAQRIGHIGSFEIDPATMTATWSTEMWRIFDLPRVDEEGPSFRLALDRVHPDDRARVEEALRGWTRSGGAFAIDHRIVLPDGAIRHVRVVGEATEDASGGTRRLIGTMQDTTALVAAAQQEVAIQEARHEVEKLRAISQFKTGFLNTAAHELATPLTPIEFQLAVLQEDRDALPRAQQEALQVVARSFLRLNSLVRDLLDAARLESGRVKVQLLRSTLGPPVEEAVRAYAGIANGAGLSLTCEIEPHGAVDIDRNRITQVLTNLIDNAIKYTPSGGEVRVRVVRSGAEAVVSVTDTGRGLLPEQIARLFQPFTQVHDEGPVRGSGGTGLGLFISRGIVEAHGGRIWCASDGPGKGSTFAFALPLRGAATGPSPAPVTANA